MPQRSWEWYLDVAKTETDPEEKANDQPGEPQRGIGQGRTPAGGRGDGEAARTEAAAVLIHLIHPIHNAVGTSCPAPRESPSLSASRCELRKSPPMPSVAKRVKERPDNSTEAVTRLSSVTDKMHALLVERADALVGCVEGSPEEAELQALTDTIEAYEQQRWPLGKIPGGKG